MVEEFCARGGGMVDVDTVASSGSFEAALHAAGGACAGSSGCLRGEDRFAFCGAATAWTPRRGVPGDGLLPVQQRRGGGGARARDRRRPRVLILDWDVHHGNGTEAIFADSDRVLYASIHQSPLYPGTGAATYAGEGAGEGYTVNLPVPPGSGRRVPRPGRSTSWRRSPAPSARA